MKGIVEINKRRIQQYLVSYNIDTILWICTKFFKTALYHILPSMYFFASRPNSVQFLTCCLNSSPVLTCRNCGKSFNIFFEIVPLPPPGLPRIRSEWETLF